VRKLAGGVDDERAALDAADLLAIQADASPVATAAQKSRVPIH